MQSLITLIARQTELELLRMNDNDLEEDQEQRIRNAVASPDCRLVFTLPRFIDQISHIVILTLTRSIELPVLDFDKYQYN